MTTRLNNEATCADEIQAVAARHNLAWMLMRDPDDPCKVAFLVIPKQFVKDAQFYEVAGVPIMPNTPETGVAV